MEDVVRHLITAAADTDESVRLSARLALCDAGRARPGVVCNNIARYLQQGQKGADEQRIQVLRALEQLARQIGGELAQGQAQELVAVVADELTSKTVQSKNHVAWRDAACDAVVAVGSSHPRMIVEKLLEHIDPGTLPPATVVRALGKLAQGHPALFVPRLKEVLMRLLPLLSSVRNSALRVAVGKALTSFCEAVITVATGGGSGSGSPVKGSAAATPDLGEIASGPAAEYHSELFSAYEVVLGNWTTARESEVRGATAEALGYIATLLRADQFSAAAVKLLQLHVGLLRNESSDPTTRIAIARGICQVLRRCASPAGQSVLAESATNLMGALHPMVGAAPDYASPSSAKAHAELLRAFEIITTGFPSTTIQFLASRLEAPEPSTRVVTCTILKHLANSCQELLTREGLRGQIISIVQPLCQDEALATRAALAQLTVALGSAGFLDVAGGDSLVWFVIQQAATPEEQARAADKAAKGAKGRTITHTQLRLMCARMVSHLANVASGPVRPLLFEALVLPKYRHALGALCDALAAVAEDSKGEDGDSSSSTAPLIDLASDVNLPKPQALAARLFVAAFAPDRGAGLGRSALRALRYCSTTISPRLAGSAATEAVSRLPEYWETLDLRRYEPAVSEADVRAAWQREVVEACRTWLRCISDEAWAMRLGEELRLQLALHEGDSALRAASFLLLGAAVAHTRHKEFARDTVTATLTAVDHANAEEAEAVAAGVGLAACADHVDLVLETVCARQRQASSQRRSSGFFGFGASGPSEEEVAREKATLARCLGQVALRAPHPLLTSRLESQIVPALLPLFEGVTDRTLRAALTDAAAHLGRAAARGRGGAGAGGQEGPAAITPTSATPLPHRSDLLAALRGFLRSGAAAAKAEVAKKKGKGHEGSGREAAEALQATLRACAALAALPPTLTAEEAAPLYDGTVDLLVSLPFRDDGSAAEEEEEEQPALASDCDTSAPLVRSATAVLRSALRQDSGAEGFAAALERLRPAAAADSPVARLRAMHAVCVLARDLVARVCGDSGSAAEAVAMSPLAAADGTGLADGAASLLPRAAGVLLPRLGDTVVEVREQALAALADLLCVHDATTAGDAEAVAPLLSGEAGASILRRLRGAERAERAAALREAACAVAATTGARDLSQLLSALVGAVTGPDPEAGDAAAQCLVALLGARGDDAAVDVLVPTLVDGLVAALRDIPRTGPVLLGGSRLETARAHAELATLAALRTLAAAHFSAVGDHLLASPLPLAPEVVRVLRALAKGEGPAEAAAGAGAEGDAREPRLRALVEQITDLLNTSAVFDGGEDGGSSLVHCALAALTALLSSPDGLMEPFVARHFAPLFCTLLLAAGSIYAANRAGIESSDAATDAVAAVRELLRCAKADSMLATFDGRPDASAAAAGAGGSAGGVLGSAPCGADDEEMHAVQHEAAAALSQEALLPKAGDGSAGAAGGDAAASHGGGDVSVPCAELLSGSDVLTGVTQMVAALGRHHPRQAAPVQAVMTSFLERPNAGHRAVAAAVVAHLLGMSVEAATQGSAPEELLASVKPGPLASALMARLSDKEAPVRIQAVTGLASLAPMWSAHAGDALANLGVQAGTLVGAIVSAAGDAAEDVACAALDSLTKLLAALPASDVHVALVNVCFRLKASVTRPHAGVRESAFRLWHCLCSGARADHAALQDDAHTLLPCLLVHVRDQRGSVRKAASRALAATAAVLEPAGEEMRSVLVRHGAADGSGEPLSPVQDFDALAADVVTLAAQRFPQRITGYLTACSELLQDVWARTRASAAVVAAAIVGQLSERERTRTNASSIVKTLTALLTTDDDYQVRARVAQALGKLAA